MVDSRRREPRPWIGITFECCRVYARIYRAPDATCYRGRCPRCYAVIRIEVGDGGTSSRMFRAR